MKTRFEPWRIACGLVALLAVVRILAASGDERAHLVYVFGVVGAIAGVAALAPSPAKWFSRPAAPEVDVGRLRELVDQKRREQRAALVDAAGARSVELSVHSFLSHGLARMQDADGQEGWAPDPRAFTGKQKGAVKRLDTLVRPPGAKSVAVVGQPGSGKSIVLLDLATSLQKSDPKRLLVVVSLAGCRASTKDEIVALISTQMVDALGLKGSAAAALVSDGVVWPLFDGLDESSTIPGDRAHCLTAIVDYAASAKDPVVVSSREDEFIEAINTRPAAWRESWRCARMEPLTRDQIILGLEGDEGEHRAHWQPVIARIVEEADRGPLTTLLRTPLGLSTVIRAFQYRQIPEELLQGEKPEDFMWDALVANALADRHGESEAHVRAGRQLLHEVAADLTIACETVWRLDSLLDCSEPGRWARGRIALVASAAIGLVAGGLGTGNAIPRPAGAALGAFVGAAAILVGLMFGARPFVSAVESVFKGSASMAPVRALGVRREERVAAVFAAIMVPTVLAFLGALLVLASWTSTPASGRVVGGVVVGVVLGVVVRVVGGVAVGVVGGVVVGVVVGVVGGVVVAVVVGVAEGFVGGVVVAAIWGVVWGVVVGVARDFVGGVVWGVVWGVAKGVASGLLVGFSLAGSAIVGAIIGAFFAQRARRKESAPATPGSAIRQHLAMVVGVLILSSAAVLAFHQRPAPFDWVVPSLAAFTLIVGGAQLLVALVGWVQLMVKIKFRTLRPGRELTSLSAPENGQRLLVDLGYGWRFVHIELQRRLALLARTGDAVPSQHAQTAAPVSVTAGADD